MNTLREMHNSLSARWRPEDAAYAILHCPETAGALSSKAKSAVQRAVPSWYRDTSMSREFQKADGLDRMLKVAADLFPDIERPGNHADTESLFDYISRCKNSLRLSAANIDFKGSRLNRADRIKQGTTGSHRSYNKRVRLLMRMEEKLTRFGKQLVLRGLARTAQTRLASCVSWEDFSSDPATAAFLTYFTARSGLRSVFTNAKQARAFDEVSDAIFAQLKKDGGKTTNWYAVALVYPMKEVIDRLTDDQKGQLLGLWFEQMRTAVTVIDELAREGHYNLQTLAVHRGNDSSTWNEAAGAFNKCREGWIATLHALKMDGLLDDFAPGKMMRLMAADVMRWHIYSKASQAGITLDYHRFDWNNIPEAALEPDTLVWRDIPKPWDVVLGRAHCNRAMIEAACTTRGIEGKGWIVPRTKTVEKFSPTPELVHGVVVASPTLAATLRKIGYFSGPSKGLKGLPTVAITRSEVDGVIIVDAEQPTLDVVQ